MQVKVLTIDNKTIVGTFVDMDSECLMLAEPDTLIPVAKIGAILNYAPTRNQ